MHTNLLESSHVTYDFYTSWFTSLRLLYATRVQHDEARNASPSLVVFETVKVTAIPTRLIHVRRLRKPEPRCFLNVFPCLFRRMDRSVLICRFLVLAFYLFVHVCLHRLASRSTGCNWNE